MSGSTMLNLSLLTSDMWSVLIRIFVYHEKVDQIVKSLLLLWCLILYEFCLCRLIGCTSSPLLLSRSDSSFIQCKDKFISSLFFTPPSQKTVTFFILARPLKLVLFLWKLLEVMKMRMMMRRKTLRKRLPRFKFEQPHFCRILGRLLLLLVNVFVPHLCSFVFYIQESCKLKIW